MISLPALPSTNAEKPVKTAGFAGLDSVFATILEGEAGTVEQAGGKILPEGGKDLPDALPPEALSASREILRRYGNMSSATVMFVLESLLRSPLRGQKGCAMAFGPGLVAETMLFRTAA